MPKFKDAVFELLRDFGEIELTSMFVVVEQPGTTDGLMLRWNCTLPAALAACGELAALPKDKLDEIPTVAGKTRRLDA